MDARSIHLQDIGTAFNYLNNVMKDVTHEHAHWVPPGNVQTIAATYAHAFLVIDFMSHTLFAGQPTLYQGEWAGKTGVSDPIPFQTPEWSKNVQVNLEQARGYGEAVLEDLKSFVHTADLERDIDMSPIGGSSQTLSWCLSMLVSGHLFVLVGEIAALKGLQGLKGDVY